MSAHTTQRDETLNVLTDADSLWGPLLFLRPARGQHFSGFRLLLVSALFGVFYGMCVNVVFALLHPVLGRAAPPVYAAPLFLSLTAFACGQVFLGAWNRRAHLLDRRLAWAEANQRVPARK